PFGTARQALARRFHAPDVAGYRSRSLSLQSLSLHWPSPEMPAPAGRTTRGRQSRHNVEHSITAFYEQNKNSVPDTRLAAFCLAVRRGREAMRAHLAKYWDAMRS